MLTICNRYYLVNNWKREGSSRQYWKRRINHGIRMNWRGYLYILMLCSPFSIFFKIIKPSINIRWDNNWTNVDSSILQLSSIDEFWKTRLRNTRTHIHKQRDRENSNNYYFLLMKLVFTTDLITWSKEIYVRVLIGE